MSAEAREASFGLRSTVRERWAIRRAQDAAAAAVVREVRALTTALSEAELEPTGVPRPSVPAPTGVRVAEKEGLCLCGGRRVARGSIP